MSISSPDWLASLWERLIDRLGLMKLPKRLYRFEDDLAWELQSMAESDQLSEEQVAAELFADLPRDGQIAPAKRNAQVQSTQKSRPSGSTGRLGFQRLEGR